MRNPTTRNKQLCMESSHMPTPLQSGFTMIELMVVVAIVATLTALAAPSFTPMLERWRARQAVEEMTATLYFARSEGVKRGGSVVIQKSGNTADCTLAATNTAWGCGWRVFFDADADGIQDAGEPTLQTAPPPSNTEITVSGNTTGRITIDRWGTFSGLSTAVPTTFIPKGKLATNSASLAICVSPAGRIRSISATGAC